MTRRIKRRNIDKVISRRTKQTQINTSLLFKHPYIIRENLYFLNVVFKKDIKLMAYFGYLAFTATKFDDQPFSLDIKRANHYFKQVGIRASSRTRMRYDKKLEDLKLIKTNTTGYPPKKHYQINYKTYQKYLHQISNIFDKIPVENYCKSILPFSANSGKNNISYIINDLNFFINQKSLKGFFQKPYFPANENSGSKQKLRSKLSNSVNRLQKPKNSNSPNSKDKPVRIIKRRNKSILDQVIDRWSEKGYPFAKVRQRETVYPILKRATVKKLGPAELLHVVDKAHKFMEMPEFKLIAKGKNIGIRQFFDKIPRQTYAFKFLNSYKIKSFVDLFRYKTDKWIEENCTEVISITNQPEFDFLRNIYPNASIRDVTLASNQMDKFFTANNMMFIAQRTHDMEMFLRHIADKSTTFKLPEEIHWLKSAKTYNNQLAPFLVKFGRFQYMSELKTI